MEAIELIRYRVMQALAHAVAITFPATVFTLALASAVLSTIDSAILSPPSFFSALIGAEA